VLVRGVACIHLQLVASSMLYEMQGILLQGDVQAECICI
jgi:hypothetical protein